MPEDVSETHIQATFPLLYKQTSALHDKNPTLSNILKYKHIFITNKPTNHPRRVSFSDNVGKGYVQRLNPTGLHRSFDMV